MTDDYIAIVTKMYEYALGADTKDWALYRGVFADEVTMDFSSVDGNPPVTVSGDDLVKAASVPFMGLDACHHAMTNPIVEIDGDTARLRIYVRVSQFFQNSEGNLEYTLVGYYDNRLIKTEGGWKVNEVTLNVFTHIGDPKVMALAYEKGMTLVSQ